MLPVVPDPAGSSIEALQDACLAVRVWADDCDDIKAATEMLARIGAVEAYLSRLDAEGPAQEAARWLEVRIGELLGPAENHGPATVSHDPRLTREERKHFRSLAAHRDIVAALVPCSRRAALKAIKQTAASDKPDSTSPSDIDTTYPTIVIDPPWRYGNTSTRGAAEDHYPTMSLEELATLHIPAADNAHLYLWVTNSFLREALDLIPQWGFTYKTILTWCKPQIGMGNYFRNNTEHVLFAIRGKQPTLRNNAPTWFVADRTRHSAKPESFYDLVETCSPGPWLEMFARRRRLGDWHTWGNEA